MPSLEYIVSTHAKFVSLITKNNNKWRNMGDLIRGMGINKIKQILVVFIVLLVMGILRFAFAHRKRKLGSSSITK
jgi:hypothetical protein